MFNLSDNFIASANAFVSLPLSKKFKRGLNSRKWFCKHYIYCLYHNDFWCKRVLADYEKALKEDKNYEITEEEIRCLSDVPEELDRRINEFSFLDNLEKFNENSSITFSDGVLMGPWFAKNKYVVFLLDDYYFKEIKKDYKKYCIMGSEPILSADYEFKQELKYFLSIQDINKFSYESMLTLKDGTLTSVWFLENLPKIKASNTKEALLVIKQYNYYLKTLSPKAFCQRVEYFSSYASPDKFSIETDICFPDGLSFRTWFLKHKKRIFESTTPSCKAIVRQFEAYERYNHPDLLFVFMKKEGYNKFEKSSKLRFYNGMVMSTWFYQNFEQLFLEETKDTLEIRRQYNEFLRQKNFVLPEGFENKVAEFLCLPINKFSKESNVTFLDGSYAVSWFEKYKNIIISYDEHRCKIMLSHYKEFLDTYSNKKDKVKKLEKKPKM